MICYKTANLDCPKEIVEGNVGWRWCAGDYGGAVWWMNKWKMGFSCCVDFTHLCFPNCLELLCGGPWTTAIMKNSLICYWWLLPSLRVCGHFQWWYSYASAFRRRRHYVFGLSVRPSVRSLKYPLLACTWVRCSTRSTVTVLRHVRPSVRLSVQRGFRAFAGERMEGMARNFTCWCILTTFRTDQFMATVSWFL